MHYRGSIKNANLLFLWGRDIQILECIFNDKQHLNNFLFAPFDLGSLNWVINNKYNFVLPDSFLTMYEKNLCYNSSYKISMDWVKSFRRNDISAFFFYTVFYQLVTMHTSFYIGMYCIKNNVNKVYAFHRSPLTTSNIWDNYDIPQAVWKDILGERYVPIDLNVRKKQNLHSEININLYNQDKYAIIENSFVVMSLPMYIQRDKKYLIELNNIRKTCWMTYSNVEENECDFLYKYNIPTIILEREFNRGTYTDYDVNNECLNWITNKFSQFPSCANLVQNYIIEKHDYFLSYAVWCRNIFLKYRPFLVCIPQTVDHLYRYIEQMCIDLDIKTIAVPHSSYQDPRCLLIDDKSKYISLCSSDLHKECVRRRAIKSRFITTSFSFTKNEYESKVYLNKQDKNSTQKNKILFILDTSQLYPGLIYVDGPAERLKFFYSIQKMKNKYSILVKFHPACPEYELWELSGGKRSETLPLDSSLEEVLRECDLAVSYNYTSSPTHIAIINDIPIIHCNTTKTNKNIHYYNALDEVLIDRGLLFAYSINEMWKMIDDILTDEEKRKNVLDMQSNLKNDIEAKSSISFHELIDKISERDNYLLEIPTTELYDNQIDH